MTTKKSKLPLGVRLNNPLNIRYNSNIKWWGLKGESKGFCVFDTMVNGFRAAFKNLYSYYLRDWITISKIIEHWAPSSENDTNAYIAFVCEKTGLTAHENIYNPWTNKDLWIKIVLAMAWYETGVSPEDFEEDCVKGYTSAFK